MKADQREISAQLEYAALIGELARPMVHEFNNFLNTVLLQVSLLEAMAPPELRADIALLGKESKNVAKVIQDWHRLNRPQSTESVLLDLNDTVRDVMKNPLIKGTISAQMTLDLSPQDISVYAPAFPLRQLCVLLLTGAVKGSPKKGSSGGRVKIRTQKKQGQAVLTVSDNGPRLSPEGLAGLFDPVRSERAGLELAVAHSLAERMHGHLFAENSLEGGAAIVLALKLSDG